MLNRNCEAGSVNVSRKLVRWISLLAFAAVGTAVLGCGATPGPALLSPVVWVEQYGAQQLSSSAETLGYGPEGPTSVAADAAGNVVVAGYVAGSFQGFAGDPGVIDGYLTKYAADGTKLWLKQYPTPAGALLGGVATDASNNIVVVGSVFSTGSSESQVFATKLDANGNPLWYVSVPASSGTSFGEQVKVDGDGNIIVAGFGYFGGSSQETLVAAKLSGANGQILWVQPQGIPAFGLLTGLALDANGNPLVVVAATDSSGNEFPFVAKLNNADGSIAWVHQISATQNSMIPFSVTSDTAGNPIVGGGSYAGALSLGFTADPQESGIVYKFNAADGSEQWHKTYSTGQGDSISGVQTIANGTIYAVGYTNGQFNSYETPTTQNTVFLLTLTSDGTLNSAHQFGTGPLANTAVPFGPLTAMDTSGNLFVAGSTTNAYPGFTNSGNALQMFIAKLTPAPLLQY